MAETSINIRQEYADYETDFVDNSAALAGLIAFGPTGIVEIVQTNILDYEGIEEAERVKRVDFIEFVGRVNRKEVPTTLAVDFLRVFSVVNPDFGIVWQDNQQQSDLDPIEGIFTEGLMLVSQVISDANNPAHKIQPLRPKFDPSYLLADED